MTEYALGTRLVTGGAWVTYVGGRALCADGNVRALARIAPAADTFFSVPASVQVRGRTVSGFVMVETLSGSSVATVDDPPVVRFYAYLYGKNWRLLPELGRLGECRQCRAQDYLDGESHCRDCQT